MKNGIVGHLRSLVVVGPVTTAVAVAILLAASTSAYAAVVKPKPTVGQLVPAGATSAVTAYSWGVTADSSWTKGGGTSVGKPNPSAVHFTKLIDSSSVPTLQKIRLRENRTKNRDEDEES
jgi:hypothetical protein